MFKLFMNHILQNKKFEQLCSFHLTEKQEELVKDFLQNSSCGLNQLYYLPFLASRGSTLEGLKHAKGFFERLKKESENINRVGSEDAGLMADVVQLMMKNYSH